MALLDDIFAGAPTDPKWGRDAKGRFPKLLMMDPEELGLSGRSGVLVLWHKGMKPAWVYVGKSNDLAQAFHDLGNNDEIAHQDIHGGLFASWSFVRDEHQDGVVRYLINVMDPKIDNPNPPSDKAHPIPVRVPGGS